MSRPPFFENILADRTSNSPLKHGESGIDRLCHLVARRKNQFADAAHVNLVGAVKGLVIGDFDGLDSHFPDSN